MSTDLEAVSAEFVFDIRCAGIVLASLRAALPDDAACAELGDAEAFQITESAGYDLELPARGLLLAFRRVENGHTFEARLSVQQHGSGGYETARAALVFAASIGNGKQIGDAVYVFLRAFLGDTGRPDFGDLLACTPEHLAECLECQEAFQNFAGKAWDAPLRGWKVPAGFADILLLSQRAKAYFAPSYLLAAVDNGDMELLDLAERALVGSREPIPSNTVIPESLGAALRLTRFAINGHCTFWPLPYPADSF